MKMRLHELHPSLVHAPLVFLPAAAFTDVLAVTAGRSIRRYVLDRAGRRLWWVGVGTALGAGLAGMAASQEVRVDDARAKDAMWIHGMGNFTLLLAAAGLATWRSTNKPTGASAAIGAAAVSASLYTAWLGGELSYGYGIGVNAMPHGGSTGTQDSPPVLSAEAPARFVKDAVKGLGWLLGRAGRLLSRSQPLTPGAAVAEASEPRLLSIAPDAAEAVVSSGRPFAQ